MFSDFKFAVRSLLKTPGFTAVALAIFAIGIGANTAIFSFVNGVMLKPLPYADSDRIVAVLEKPPGGDHNPISALNYLDWKKENSVFEFMAAQAGGAATLTGVDEPVPLRGMRVTADYFKVFGVNAAVGRTFTAGEDQPGNDRVVIISHALWQTQFAGNLSVVGRTVMLDGHPHTIIGVLPKGSAFDRGWPQIWRPLPFPPENRTRNFHSYWAIAKLKPGIALEQARANMGAIAARIARDYPETNKGWGVAIDPFADLIVGKELKRSLYVLLASVGMVLLIGCANLANLMLARGMTRDREVAVRVALGAGRWQLMRQFLTESVLLAVSGGILGLAIGYGTIVGLKILLPPYSLPAEADIAMDGHVLIFTFLLAVFTGIACGLAPALQATRSDLTGAMKQGGGGASAGRVRHRTRTALVIAEVALTFVLLVGAGLLLRSFARMQNVDTGFDSTNVLTANFPIPQQRFAEPASFNAYLRQVRGAISALPGVRDVAFTSALPMQGSGYGMGVQRTDQPMADVANRKFCFFKMVSPSYFRAIGLELVKGRALTERDTKGSPPVALINQTMREKYFAGEDPIGKRILVQEIAFGKTSLGPDVSWEVVGVVADEKIGSLAAKEGAPGLYVTTEQSPQLMQALVIRTASDPALLHQPVREAVTRINADQSLSEMKTLDQIKNESLGGSRLNTILLGVFAGVALLLAAIGIYGVISYSVVQRTREMGIRAALGADMGKILRLVLRNGMTTVMLGLLIGAVGAFALTRLISSLLFGISERDPATLAAVAILLAAAALIACYLPARRAAKVDPIVALRAE